MTEANSLFSFFLTFFLSFVLPYSNLSELTHGRCRTTFPKLLCSRTRLGFEKEPRIPKSLLT
jgi:hypothetical protein